MVYSGAWGKLIREKNQKPKNSWYCPFKFRLMQEAKIDACTVVLYIYTIPVPSIIDFRRKRTEPGVDTELLMIGKWSLPDSTSDILFFPKIV